MGLELISLCPKALGRDMVTNDVLSTLWEEDFVGEASQAIKASERSRIYLGLFYTRPEPRHGISGTSYRG